VRILHLTHNYPRFPADPAGGFVARLARAAVAAGSQVRVVAPHFPGTAVAEDDAGVEVRRFRYGPELLERIGYTGDLRKSAFSFAALLAAPAYLWRFNSACTTAIAEFRPDVIHAHWWFPAGVIATRQAKVPVVITCHGSDVRLLGQSEFLRNLARKVLPKARTITTVSRVMRTDLKTAVPDLESTVRLEIAPLPVDLPLFERGASVTKATPPLILFAGNLIAGKGVDVLLTAFATLRADGIDCRLKFLGEGVLRDELERSAASLGVSDRVEWSPFVPMDRMPEEYGAATIVALPSRGARGEGMPLSLVEALVGGAAVVATPAGGVPEIIQDGETGLLVPDGDAPALANALRRLITEPELRTRLVAAGRSQVTERFAPGPAAARFLRIYQGVLHGD
jgi:glycosyltransferase involved in cell wall biosynthesis